MTVAERVPLKFVLEAEHRKEQEPIVPFPATFGEAPVIVTAILERTAIVSSTTDSYDRQTLTFDRVMVDPMMLEWRPATGARSTANGQLFFKGKKQRWNGAVAPEPLTAEARQKVRDEGDQRALESQAAVSKSKRGELAAVRKNLQSVPAEAVLARVEANLEAAEREPSPRPKVVLVRLSRADAEALRAQGLKRCFKCKRDMPIAEVNSAGYCRHSAGCKAARNASSDATSAVESPPAMSQAAERTKDEPMKFCPSCKEWKPKSGFPGGKGFSACTQCRDSKPEKPPHTEAMERNLELAQEGKKRCGACKQEKPLDAFNKNASKGDGYQSICRECISNRWTAGSTETRKQAATPTLEGLLEDVRRLRKERDELRVERDQLLAEKARIFASLKEVLA